jgi:calcium-dependent protein kinase
MGCIPRKNDKTITSSNYNSSYRKIKTVKNGHIVEKIIQDFKINKSFLVPENTQDPYDVYSIIKCLGEGSFGQVFEVQHKLTMEKRAMKIINKYVSPLSDDDEENILKEIKLLRMLDHPNIIKIHEYYNTKRKLFIITELCTGGELFDRIIEVKYFTETVAAHIMKQIFSATAFCHANHIVHRDLKPENILIENLDERKKNFFNIKIADFGTGEINKHKMLSEKTGTAYYIAPEVLNKKYNEKCDMWSCGVILYILLCGSPPFSGKSDDEIFKKIKDVGYHYKGKMWEEISIEAKDLISKLLTKDISKRLSAQDALNHDWFKFMFSEKNKETLEKQKEKFTSEYLSEIVTNIQNFRSEKKLQQAALAFIVHNLAKTDDIKELRNVFMAFDLNGDGRLTKDELIEGLCQVMTKGEAYENVETMMGSLDVDKNGFIEYEEFLTATLNKKKLLSKENIKIAFEMFDKDNSGYISKDKLKIVLGSGSNNKLNDDVWSTMVKEIDHNKDGKISFEEFLDVMYKLV